jgi:Respiratory-chain NADH dehydrogenase 51 Kd subunit
MTTNASYATPLNEPDDSESSAPAPRDERRHLSLVEPAPSTPGRRPHKAWRVLHPWVLTSLDEYRSIGGLTGLEVANDMQPADIAATVLDAGLRGRGGAGFPAGRKWQTVAENSLAGSPATVVVNGAEGEPGTFKDRSILRRNPYQVIEGALIAARAVHATRVVIALKRSFVTEVERTRLARSNATPTDLETIEYRIGTVDYGARCYLAAQQETVLTSIFERFRHEFDAHLHRTLPPAEPVLVTELLEIHDGIAMVDEGHRRKQPDRSYRARWSGSVPAEIKTRFRREAKP